MILSKIVCVYDMKPRTAGVHPIYVTYVLHKAPLQLDTLEIVQYLHYIGKSMSPITVCERNHPHWVSALPSIEDCNGMRFVGLDACVTFWQTHCNESNLIAKASSFKQQHPHYRIHD